MNQQKQVLQALADKVSEFAAKPVMEKRRLHWRSIKNLETLEPAILVEVGSLEGFVPEQELICTDPEARRLEHHLRMVLRHASLGDDYVVDDHISIPWEMSDDGFGVEVEAHRTEGIGYSYEHPIHSPESLADLRDRTFSVERDRSLERCARLEEWMNGQLPVQLNWGMYPLGITHDALRLTGNDNLMLWCYDEPDSVRFLVDFLRRDRIRMINVMEDAEALSLNHAFHFVGSGSPGHVSGLPAADFTGHVRPRDLWCWMESQETTAFSPDLFSAFFLPAMADVANRFGLTYYGCCERLDDRIDRVIEMIPNIRAISASPWSDIQKLCSQTGSRHVISRKPSASFLSGSAAFWNLVEEETAATVVACREFNCPSEYIFRDLYTVGSDFSKLVRWIETVRRMNGR